MLSDVALEILREYQREYKPQTWLFPGANQGQHITTRTVQAVFEQARKKEKIGGSYFR